MEKYRIPLISFFILILAIVYMEMFLEDYKVIVPLSKSWEKALPHQEIPQGLVSLQAKSCGTCHVQHYQEWQKSTHAQAWKDLQFQAELKKESSPFMCINCHIPLQNQQEYIITGLENGDIYKPVKTLNPKFDPQLQQEGITCVSCHVRNNVIIGPTGSLLAPHAVIKDTIHLSENLCISCHNANAVVTPTLACSFETGDEWKAGPFFGKKNCISCHMPETHRSIVAGMPSRKSRFHSFPASGIPKLDTLKPERLESLSFKASQLKKTYRESDSLQFSLSLTNDFAGHKVPSGNPERFIMVVMTIYDKNNLPIHTVTGRIGEHWEWHPEAKKISDNNLDPGETRTFKLQYLMADAGKYKLKVKVSKHRLTPESAAYNKLGNNYPLFIDVYEKVYDIKVL